MNFAHLLVLFSALLTVVAASAYIRDTLKGKTKPNRVSWLLWALFPLIGTAAAFQANADIWATIRVLLAGFLPLIIFLTSFWNQKSYWRLTLFDWFCGACALLAIAVWFILDSPKIGILFAVIGDGFAALPTFVKAWKYPKTETGLTYMINLIAVLLVIPSIPTWNIENSAFQIYLLAANLILIISIYRKKFSASGR
ncbi:MAG TPA: hypothetical protein VLG76_06425 [Rhabdochlamydiaceae bacterium]|nr:hypothetical protein [Rhabdochlamydiaceae bacterium]HSX38687.1 hypothetical protein [Chlamydiales bacterium]